MPELVYKINLIKSDTSKNNNKFWTGSLMNNDDVLCEWGRIGETGQSKTFSKVGRSFLDKKVAEKKKDGRNGEIGYREIQLINEVSAVVKTETNLEQIAKKQIRYKNPIVGELIEYLIQVNAHDIFQATSGKISYNYDSGLFQTPLGLVTQSNLDQSQIIFSEIQELIVSKDFSSKLIKLTNDYLMLIPQSIPRSGLDVKEFWSSNDNIKKQNGIIEGLQSSLINAKPKTIILEKEEVQVFDTELDLVVDNKIKNEIFENYLNKRDKNHHQAYSYTPINLWNVNIEPMKQSFLKYGVKLENQIQGYHGSSSVNVLSLLKTGFLKKPPETTKLCASMFANGTYTAPYHVKGSSTKALNYSLGVWGGAKSRRNFIFICDIGMGKIFYPKTSLSSPPKGFDSCWAKKGETVGWHGPLQNDECIVYREDQINIKYLMEVK